MSDHAVLIAGGGPDGSPAGGLHARTVEVLDVRGSAERCLSAGVDARYEGVWELPVLGGSLRPRPC